MSNRIEDLSYENLVTMLQTVKKLDFGFRPAMMLREKAVPCFARRYGIHVAVLVLSMPAVLPAQDFLAKLTVTVADPTGSAIPSAELELRRTATTEVLPGKTNETGVYYFLFLQPGTYSLKVSAAGFKPVERTGIVLQSHQATGLTINMEIGGVNDRVTVTAEGALLDTESASRGVTMGSRLVNDLVLTGQQVSRSGAGDIRMKPYFPSNLALSKNFRFHERVNFRLRLEATNVLNHFNMLTARFNTNISDPNFGTVFQASTSSLDAPPRVVRRSNMRRTCAILIAAAAAWSGWAWSQQPDPPGQARGASPKNEAYLFAHMMHGDYGQLYYTVSLDGLHWRRLNGGNRVLEEYHGHPDICRGHDGRYYLIGNRSDSAPDINFWVSGDLIRSTKYADFTPDLSHVPNYPSPPVSGTAACCRSAAKNTMRSSPPSESIQRRGEGDRKGMKRFWAAIILTAITASAGERPRWSKAEAIQWYAQQPWLVGANYIPATAINQLEMWQADTFDPNRIDLELR